MNCYDCDCWDSDREGCTMPSIDMGYACPIEGARMEAPERAGKGMNNEDQ